MIESLPGPIRGSLSLMIYAVNTVFWRVTLFFLPALKAIIPLKSWRLRCSRVLHAIAETWIRINNLNQTLIEKILRMTAGRSA